MGKVSSRVVGGIKKVVNKVVKGWCSDSTEGQKKDPSGDVTRD